MTDRSPAPDRIVYLAGVARSGTSWAGQVFNSCPDVAFSFQPLFAYEFTGRVDEDSTAEEYERLFAAMLDGDTPFLTQADKRASGEYPTFVKASDPRTLVLKENRYQTLVEPMLRRVPRMTGVGVVRHPCAVLNSWRKNPREFPPGSIFADEWRFARCKNTGPQDYFGYYRWKEVAHLYLDLQDKYPSRFRAVRYEDLVRSPSQGFRELFAFTGLPFGGQTEAFLDESTHRHTDGYYGVYKSSTVADAWRAELDGHVVEEILADLAGTRLARFVAEDLPADGPPS